MPQFAPAEIRALAAIVDDLNYYQLLKVEQGASAKAVKDAYYVCSRTFHPDANRQLDAALRQAVGAIARRISEAYVVLRDPRRRMAYDEHLEQGSGLRMQLAEAEAEAKRKATVYGETPQGKQHATLALADLRKGDLAGAARHLQMGLAFEPGNASFSQKLEELKQQLEELRKQSKQPYKIG